MLSIAFNNLIIVRDKLTSADRDMIKDWKGGTFYFPNINEADRFIDILKDEYETRSRNER